MDSPVEVEGLSKRYGKLEVLAEVSLRFDAGQTTAVVGPNGAGKTTLIKALLGLVRQDSGRVRILGKSIEAGPGYREHIGYMPQAPAFPENLSGNDVLDLIAKVRGRHAPAALELQHRFSLQGEMEKPIRTLSGGTRQKLSAVVGFMFEPAILILDEPTAGLDPVASGVLKEYVKERAREGSTVILTSHVMADLEELSDRVVFLMDGRPRFDGGLADLRLRTGKNRLEQAIAHMLTREVA